MGGAASMQMHLLLGTLTVSVGTRLNNLAELYRAQGHY
jgi:hypothetical protein